MNNLILIISLLFFSNCSSINEDSKAHHESKNKHGLKTLEPVYKPSIKIQMSKPLIALGKTIYQENCLACHGKNGMGDGPEAKNQKVKPANLNKAVNEVEHFAFYTRFSYWDGSMPGWDREFSKKELDALTAYLYQFKKN